MHLPLSSLARELRLATQAGAALALLGLAAGCGGESSDKQGSGGSVGQGGNSGSASGGALAAKGGEASSGGASASSGGVAAGDGGVGAMAGHDGNPPPLAPYATTNLGCFGETFTGPYEGQCCVAAQCYDPAPGSTCATADDDNLYHLLAHYPPGSGTCTCDSPGHPYVDGPYAMNSNDMPLSTGQCCYLIGSISCEGRPLVLDGLLALASVMERADWALELS